MSSKPGLHEIGEAAGRDVFQPSLPCKASERAMSAKCSENTSKHVPFQEDQGGLLSMENQAYIAVKTARNRRKAKVHRFEQPPGHERTPDGSGNLLHL
jgi:hypothetical protein